MIPLTKRLAPLAVRAQPLQPHHRRHACRFWLAAALFAACLALLFARQRQLCQRRVLDAVLRHVPQQPPQDERHDGDVAQVPQGGRNAQCQGATLAGAFSLLAFGRKKVKEADTSLITRYIITRQRSVNLHTWEAQLQRGVATEHAQQSYV